MKHETPRHPKLQNLAAAINMPLFAAAGILELLWHYAGDFTPRGDIGSASDVSIARAVDWRKRPNILIRALVDTGWIDHDPTYRLIIHDWPEHAQEWVRVKLKRRQPHDDWLSVYGSSLYSVATNERQNIDLPLDGKGLGSGSGKIRKKEKTEVYLGQNADFDEFWAAYWRKVDKITARKSYHDQVVSHELADQILIAVNLQNGPMHCREAQSRPHAATWLNHHRWEDEPDPEPNGNVRLSRAERIAKAMEEA